MTDEEKLAWLVEHQPELSDMLNERGRWRWLANTMKSVAIWIAAIMAGWLALQAAVADFANIKDGH